MDMIESLKQPEAIVYIAFPIVPLMGLEPSLTQGLGLKRLLR